MDLIGSGVRNGGRETHKPGGCGLYELEIKSCRFGFLVFYGDVGRQIYSAHSPQPNGTTWKESSCKQSLLFLDFDKMLEMFHDAVFFQNKMPVPRSSSPVSVYVELPSIVDQGKLHTWSQTFVGFPFHFLFICVLQLFQLFRGMIWRVAPLSQDQIRSSPR